MSEMCVIPIENSAIGYSPTYHTMMHGVTEKAATSSSFSERVKNPLRCFFPFTMGKGTVDEVDPQEEEEHNGENDDFESQVGLISSTHENQAPTNMETGDWDLFGAVRTITRLLMECNCQENS